ncbi:acylphosphatase [Mesorhizobium carmichaelinearum]|uniref:acylphosphatase n=1 Tax=Mesorhizobium carmichaelinearum TaxID=1208188 RepID=UPI001FCEB38A|nr:acylphosphatase [Mesorhizobium carmichaelinearum]
MAQDPFAKPGSTIVVHALMTSEEIRIRGLVQGVGFRPFVWQLVARHGIRGEVLNDGEGVLIRATGDRLDDFCRSVLDEAPPLARIRSQRRSALPSIG